MNDDEEVHELTVQLQVPAHLVDEDGNLKPEGYEPFFNMLGKEYGDATILSIEIGDVTEALD